MSKNDNIDIESIIIPGDTSIYKTKESHLYDNHNNEVFKNVILIPLDNEVFFPYMQISAVLSHTETVASIKKAFRDKKPVIFFLASESLPEDFRDAEIEDVYHSIGTLGFINSIEENNDGTLSYQAILGHQGKIINLLRRSPYLRSDIKCIFAEQITPCEEEHKIEKEIENLYQRLASFLPENDTKQLNQILSNIPIGTIRRFFFMLQNSPMNSEKRYEIYKIENFSSRRRKFLAYLEEELLSMQVKMELNRNTMAEISNRQREDILRAQLRQIKMELGENEESDEEELRIRAGQKNWSDATHQHFSKEISKLLRFNPSSPDYAVQYSYLDRFLNLPWLFCDNSDFSLKDVRRKLDEDHYGLEKVKERIIEQMAVLKLRGDTRAPILCLYGPPGVGKTSLGKSVAEAVGRKYARVALGGLHDEAEIRGHRRTYIASMPGRIIHALEQCGTSDPVLVLDEIDKIGNDFKGDPSQALLEVLDPEQNMKFHDNYIDFDYDLSKVLFIATANNIQNIPAPLLDRMELIEIGGYSNEEKIEIALRHIINKSLIQHGFKPDSIKFDSEALLYLIQNYTRESGVRHLEKKINKIIRKLAILKVEGKKLPKSINQDKILKFLGKPEIFNDKYENNDIPGIVTGLAWTQAGGDILFIESSISPGKDQKLVLTGNLGDVMKESAMLAIQYLKSNHHKLNINDKQMEYGTLHIHVPEGAVPKDGPSAGITILTSLMSTFTCKKVKSHIAMTGEMTLRGKVLPVGGIKEKLLAAKRAGIKTVILSSKNRKDVEEIKKDYLTGLDFYYVDNVDQVLEFAIINN